VECGLQGQVDRKGYQSAIGYSVLIGLTDIGRLTLYATAQHLFIVAHVISVLLTGIKRKLTCNALLGERIA
jgi:hypothetical protein